MSDDDPQTEAVPFNPFDDDEDTGASLAFNREAPTSAVAFNPFEDDDLDD